MLIINWQLFIQFFQKIAGLFKLNLIKTVVNLRKEDEQNLRMDEIG